MYINLHVHSRYSDGTLDISELFDIIKRKNIRYFSLTDHDTLNGYAEIKKEHLEGIYFINGVEISTRNHDYLHILGYGIKKEIDYFKRKLADFREKRIARVKEMIEKLQRLGIDITYSDLKISDLATVGRPHIADALINKGYGRSRGEAFFTYLVEGREAYVPPKGPDVAEAVELIKRSGGFAILAHPSTIERYFDIERIIAEFDFDGIEAFYPTHNETKITRYIEIAKKYNLIVTAGTDYHGPNTDRQLLDLYEYDRDIMVGVERMLDGSRS